MTEQAAHDRTIEALVRVLRAELSSAAAHVTDYQPDLHHAPIEARSVLAKLEQASQARAAELAERLSDAGEPLPMPQPTAEQQFLAFVSLAALLPPLIAEKQALADLCRAELAECPDDLIRRHAEAHEAELSQLRGLAR